MIWGLVPCWKFKETSKEEQLAKIKSEVGEVAEAMKAGDDEAAVEEIMDVMVCCMTMLRVHYRVSWRKIKLLIQKVNQKNKRRGYHLKH